MKVCIYGAGAIGGWIGVHLAQTGHSISVVARGDTLQALQKNGLQCIQTQDPEKILRAQVSASANPADLGPQDLVIVAVKAPSMRDIANNIAPLLAPHTMVMPAMNGVPWWFFDGFGGALQGTRLKTIDPDGQIGRAIPSQHVVGCVVHASCSLDAPGVVRHHFGQGLILGEPAEQQGSVSLRVQQLVADLQTAGFNASASAQIGCLQNIHVARCRSGQSRRTRCLGQCGAGVGSTHPSQYPLHRCAAGLESPACQGARALPCTMTV